MISKTNLYIVFLFLFLMAVTTGCGGSGSGDNADASGGGVGFNLSWESAALQGTQRMQPQLVTGNPCLDYQIEWIHGTAIDQSGHEQKTVMWACSDRHGEITGLPAGTYRIVILGEVADEKTWRGEAAGVEIVKDQKADAGKISMVHRYDQAAPTVIATFPVDGAQGVAVDSTVTATFDGAVVADSITADNFMLTYLDSASSVQRVDGSVSYDAGNNRAALSPGEPLLNDTVYTATIVVDRTPVVEDMAGNPMQQAVQWTFRSYRPDIEGPEVVSRTRQPTDLQMNVSLTTDVQFEFSEPVNPATIITGNIFLQHEGVNIPIELELDPSQTGVTLFTETALQAGSTYTVLVSTAVTDVDGNPMAEAASWSFVTRFASWRIEASTGGMALSKTAIAIETNNRIHISFTSPDEKMLNLVRLGENDFDLRSGSGTVKMSNDTVIDPRDFRHKVLMYTDETSFLICSSALEAGGALWCGYLDDTIDPGWVTIAVDSGPDGDAYGNPAVCYYNRNDSKIKYAAATSTWEVETVATVGEAAPSLAMAPSGTAHVSYVDPATDQLIHATKPSGGSWETGDVDTGVTAGEFSDIVVDRSGNPHISYVDLDSGALKYATRLPSGSWRVEPVTPDASASAGGSIVLDALGNAHISFMGTENKVLKCASRTSLGLWHVQTVDDRDVGTTGNGSSILVDSDNYLHISYLHRAGVTYGSFVRYATTRPLD